MNIYIILLTNKAIYYYLNEYICLFTSVKVAKKVPSGEKETREISLADLYFKKKK